MRRIGTIVALLVLTQLTAFAQDWDPSGVLKKLSAKASKTVDVTLDQSMLQFASAFLDPKDPEQAQAKKIIANMKGIYVHNLEFEKSGEYTDEELAVLRTPLKEPQWSRIVNVRSKHEGQHVEVYFKKEGEKFTGLVVIATEPDELTWVNIVGPLNPEDLRRLGGQFGIPRIDIDQNSSKKEENK
jgi:Domain of unknown function (DUF4252)